MKNSILYFVLLLGVNLICTGCSKETETLVVDEKENDKKEVVEKTIKVDTTTAEYSAWNLHYRMGVGVNISTFEAPCEGCWSGNWDADYPQIIKNKGFGSVRLPVRYDNKVGAAPDYTIDPAWMNRITEVIDQIMDPGLVCILDFHHINSLDENPSQENQDMFVKVWEQLSLHYKDYSDNLLFELYNEPKGEMTDEILNSIYQRAYTKIREHNPERVIIFGGNRWNNTYDLINDVWIPEDDKFVMGTFHRYKPNEFTHQKEGENVKFTGTPEEIAMAQDGMQDVSDWSNRTGIPVLLGEFGSVKWGGTTSRVIWTQAVVDGAKKYDFSMAYWCFNGAVPDGWLIYDTFGNEQWLNSISSVILN